MDKKIWLSKSVIRSVKITNQEKETKREDFGVVYGSVLGLIDPHVQRKEELSTTEKVEDLVVVQEVESRKKISKVTCQIIIRFHTIQAKKIKVQKVSQPHILGFMQEGQEL